MALSAAGGVGTEPREDAIMPHDQHKAAARAYQARHGVPWREALRRTAGASPVAASPDWSALYGVELTLTGDQATLRGVLLPPTEPGGTPRVAVTTGEHTGEVCGVEPREYWPDPSPETVEERFAPSKRRTRGPRGLPLYRSDNLPTSVLATVTMLRRQHRRRPAPGQTPVAEYFAMRDYTELYAIADTEDLPALSPARQAAWIAARTCAACGARHLDPLPAGHGGSSCRYCVDCREEAARAAWYQRRGEERAAASAWAREVLADPTVVWVHSCWGPSTPLVLTDHTGALLAEYPAVRVLPDAPRPSGLVSTEVGEVVELVGALARRRVLSWGEGARPISLNLARAGYDLAELTTGPGDEFGERYTQWLGEPLGEQDLQRRAFATSMPPLMTVVAPESGRERVTEAHRVLREMVAGAPTSARCVQARAARSTGGYRRT